MKYPTQQCELIPPTLDERRRRLQIDFCDAWHSAVLDRRMDGQYWRRIVKVVAQSRADVDFMRRIMRMDWSHSRVSEVLAIASDSNGILEAYLSGRIGFKEALQQRRSA